MPEISKKRNSRILRVLKYLKDKLPGDDEEDKKKKKVRKFTEEYYRRGQDPTRILGGE